MRYGFVASCGLVVVLAGVTNALAGEPQAPAAKAAPAKSQPEAKPPVYNEQADARQQIDEALKVARRDDKRVLLVFGGNWCGWCLKLHKVFEENDDLARLLRYEYAVAWIDSQQLKEHKELGAAYQEEIGKHGVPFCVVLDRNGAVLTMQNTGALESGPNHDTEKLSTFLKNWIVPRPDAEKLLADAQTRAKTEGKLVLLYFSTPTCGWCHKLTEFLSAQAAAFGRDYVPVRIDLVRMTNGREVAKRFGCEESKGVPWEAIVDGNGQVQATSDGPEGNIGYPSAPAEIEHFIAMLKKTARHNTPEQIVEIATALKGAATR